MTKRTSCRAITNVMIKYIGDGRIIAISPKMCVKTNVTVETIRRAITTSKIVLIILTSISKAIPV